MKVQPLTKRAERPIALVVPRQRELTIYTEAGQASYRGRRSIETALAKISGHLCYVTDSLGKLRHTTGAMSWRCSTWRGREVRMEHIPSGAQFVSLRGTLDYEANPWEALMLCLGWVRGYGVRPGSIPSMAWQLWRSTLETPLVINFDDGIGAAAFYGGRQQIREPKVYSDQVAWDIRAAYPTAMASRPYALALTEVDRHSRLDPEQAGLAMAQVQIPHDLPFGPLPVRVMPGVVSFQAGYVEGVWTWGELAAAQALGCSVDVIRSWAPRREADLFGAWWPLVASGRELPGGAGVLAKAIANSTWGQFGMVGTDRGQRTWADDAGKLAIDQPAKDRRLPHQWTAHIAAETTSRVRVRLLTEGLYSGAGDPIHIDTDGIIVPAGSPPPARSGSGPGEWRMKDRMGKVDVRGPQLFRWTCDGCETGQHEAWHYNASGIPADQVRSFFDAPTSTVPSVGYQVVFDRPVVLAAEGGEAQPAQR